MHNPDYGEKRTLKTLDSTHHSAFHQAGNRANQERTHGQQHALVLAAHGSRRNTQANTLVDGHVGRLKDVYRFPTVKAAFNQGTPHYSEVLDSLTVNSVTIVPLFSSDGYFSRTVLPRELSLNRRYSQIRLRLTEAVGTHARIPALAQRRILELLRHFQLEAQQTSLIVVGHGSQLHPTSSASTHLLVDYLRKAKVCQEVQAAFLDESPFLEDVSGQVLQPEVVVFPFFIGDSYHVLQDIPRRAGFPELAGSSFPAQRRRGSKHVTIDRALGVDPEITALIAALAAPGLAQAENGVSS